MLPSPIELVAGAPAWEEWLRGRFPGYLLHEADGEPRDADAIQRALELLTGSPGALQRLAALGFLLDPARGVHSWVTEQLPRFLRRVFPRTIRRIDERRGVLKGRPHWPRTLAMRTRMRDPSWFVTVNAERNFETDALLLVRWLVHRIVATVEDIEPRSLTTDDAEHPSGWTLRLAATFDAAGAAVAHAALRSLPVERPDAERIARCAADADPTVRDAARLIVWHDSLLPRARREPLADTLQRFSLAPLDVNKRFEIFTLLTVVAALDAVLIGAARKDWLITSGRKEVVRWTTSAGLRVRVFYDQASRRAHHADVIDHYFGLYASVRPDVRIVVDGGGTAKRMLYVDAKNGGHEYMRASHLKMLGYVAEQREGFGSPPPHVVILCPLEVRGAVRLEDAVVFVDAVSAASGDQLRALFARFVYGTPS